MAISRQDARKPSGAVTQTGRGDSAQRVPTSGFDQKTAVRLVRLGVLGHMLRSPRFYERIIVGIIVLAALRGLGQDNRASTMARLAAWNKRELQRLERKVKR